MHVMKVICSKDDFAEIKSYYSYWVEQHWSSFEVFHLILNLFLSDNKDKWLHMDLNGI